MFFQIDLRDQGTHGPKLLRRGAVGAAEQLQGVLRELSPGAAPFDDEETLVREGSEQPSLGDAEERRTIDKHIIVAVPQLTHDTLNMFVGKQRQWIIR